MAHRVLHDPEADGWERSDFPIVCETCLGPNPYVRMQRLDYGAECHISKRPYTKFRWRPGSDARYKSTIICQEVAKAKNVCQVCLLDLSHNLPVQVRDQLTNAVVEDIPESQVGLEYQLALKESRGELGKQYQEQGEETNEQLNRLSRTQPYYKRNRAQICTFFLRGECKRGAECPYRHEMPEGDSELAHQNIRDRYYGVNDPVARKMLRRLGERPRLEPPEDPTITTLYVGNIERHWTEDELRNAFKKYGDISRLKLVPNKSCAFVTFATRKEAETAAEKLHDALIINGVRCKLLWGKPQANQQQNSMAPSGAAAPNGAAGPNDVYGQPLVAPDGSLMPPPRFFGPAASYPSMDPSQKGSTPRGPGPEGGQPMPHMMPGAPPGGMPPAGVPPHQWPYMHPPGPMPGMGMPVGMRPPMGAMPPPVAMAAAPAPHPGAQSGFGMTAPQKMIIPPHGIVRPPATDSAPGPVAQPTAAQAQDVPQAASAPAPTVESTAA